MYKNIVFCGLIFGLSLFHYRALAQEQPDSITTTKIAPPDTSNLHNNKSSDSGKVNAFDPRKATIRSAILPGWGQAYNKKYWKIPIVYSALGISAGFFFSNVKTYNELRQAVIYRQDNDPLNDSLIKPYLQPLTTQALMQYRSTWRQYIDYSVLVFILFWGLNVVDATVDAHLKGFNVSPDLTLKIRPNYKFDMNRGNIGLVFQLEKREFIFKLPH